jgi:hypothetical protein
MRIDYVVCPANIEDKLISKHHVTAQEARQAILNNHRIRFAEQGYIEGEDVYAAFGRTFGGRYWQCSLVTTQPEAQNER